MAKAEKFETEYGIKLELTQREAEVLREVIYSFVGGPQHGPRGFMNNIGVALADAGVYLKNNVTSESSLFLSWGRPNGEL